MQRQVDSVKNPISKVLLLVSFYTVFSTIWTAASNASRTLDLVRNIYQNNPGQKNKQNLTKNIHQKKSKDSKQQQDKQSDEIVTDTFIMKSKSFKELWFSPVYNDDKFAELPFVKGGNLNKYVSLAQSIQNAVRNGQSVTLNVVIIIEKSTPIIIVEATSGNNNLGTWTYTDTKNRVTSLTGFNMTLQTTDSDHTIQPMELTKVSSNISEFNLVLKPLSKVPASLTLSQMNNNLSITNFNNPLILSLSKDKSFAKLFISCYENSFIYNIAMVSGLSGVQADISSVVRSLQPPYTIMIVALDTNNNMMKSIMKPLAKSFKNFEVYVFDSNGSQVSGTPVRIKESGSLSFSSAFPSGLVLGMEGQDQIEVNSEDSKNNVTTNIEGFSWVNYPFIIKVTE